MRRYLYWGISAVAVGGVAVAIALFAGPIGKWAVPEGVRSAEADLLQSCDPNNQIIHKTEDSIPLALNGPAFKSSGSGTARAWETELEHPSFAQGDDTSATDYPGAKLVWSFLQVATEDTVGTYPDSYTGDVYGFLVAKVKWDNGQEASFHSRCLREVITKGGTIRTAEVTAEGDVTGFPFDTSKQSAVAKLKMKRDTNTRKVQVQFIVRLGSACYEGNGEKEFTVVANSIETADCDGDPDGACGDGLTGLRENGVAAGVLKSPDSNTGIDIPCNGS